MIMYSISPPISNDALNALFARAWPEHSWTDFQQQLQHSLAYVCGYAGEQLIGFVNLAWDGGIHAFLLDTTVHADWQGRGIGKRLVQEAVIVARARGMYWLHVDYEPQLEQFYQSCGFRPTHAGLIQLPSTS